jgi:hypothetical protein
LAKRGKVYGAFYACYTIGRGIGSRPAVPRFCRLFSPYTSRRLCGSLWGACRWGYNFMGRALAALCACAGRSAGGIKQQHKKGAADSRGRRSVMQNFINCGSGSASAPTAWGCWAVYVAISDSGSGRAYPVGRFRRSDIATYYTHQLRRVCGIGSGLRLGQKMSEFYFCGLFTL